MTPISCTGALKDVPDLKRWAISLSETDAAMQSSLSRINPSCVTGMGDNRAVLEQQRWRVDCHRSEWILKIISLRQAEQDRTTVAEGSPRLSPLSGYILNLETMGVKTVTKRLRSEDGAVANLWTVVVGQRVRDGRAANPCNALKKVCI